MTPGRVALLLALSAAGAGAAQAAGKSPAPPAAHPLEKTFVQGDEAERAWGAECPVRESVAAGETRLLDLSAAKLLSDEVPIVRASVEKNGKVKVVGIGPGLTVLRVQQKKAGQALVCLRVTSDKPVDLPSPGPCALPKGTAALLVQSVGLEVGSRVNLPAPGWKRFSVDAPDVAAVAGVGPDELALEGRKAGRARLHLCQGTKVEVIDLVVAAKPR